MNRQRFIEEITSFFDRSPQSQFDVLLCDNSCRHALKTWEYVLNTKEYRRHLDDSLNFFSATKKHFQNNPKYRDRFTVKMIDFVPVSITFIDPSSSDGIAVVTPNIFEQINTAKPCYIISGKSNRAILDSYWQRYYHYFTAMPSKQVV